MLINETYYVVEEDGTIMFIEAEEVKDAKEKGLKVMKAKSDEDDEEEEDDEEMSAEEVEELEAELIEFKADGENSSTADPVGGQTPTRRADKRNPEAKPMKPGSGIDYANASKSSMLSGMVKSLKSMDNNELSSLYKKIVSMSKQGLEIQKEETDEDEEDVKAKDMKKKVSKDDVDVEEDIKAIFKGSDLSEEFQSKATEIFEAAVVSKVNDILESVYIDQEAQFEIAKVQMEETLDEQLNEYLEYVVTNWMGENTLAVEKGIRAEIAENVLEGLKSLFDENYIEVPEDKIDIIEELVAKNEELEEELNQATAAAAGHFNKVKEFETEIAFVEAADGLSDTEEAKLKSLAESIDFDSVEQYKEKLSSLRESYFGEDDNGVELEILDESDSGVALDEESAVIIEEEVNPTMNRYVDAISKTLG